jgi:transcriptional regulator with XRE-family HTH domain
MNRLKELRKRAYLSQAELAEKTDLTEATIVALEKGRRRPQYKTIRTLAAVLNVQPSELEFE